MKQLTALVLAFALLLCGVALAVEWKQGLGPQKPYTESPEVDLNTTFGYIILFPRNVKAADGFCNKLQMYFPRDDIQMGQGLLTLYENVPGETKPVEVCSVDMGDSRSVTIRPMTEREMESVIWGSGMCAEIRLPKSLEYADRFHDYFVFTDEGVLTAGPGGNIKSPRISREEAWKPTINGEYGVSGIYYVDAELPKDLDEEAAMEALFAELEAAADAADAEREAAEANGEEVPEETPEPTATPEPEVMDMETLEAQPPVAYPDTGDRVIFDLVLGGEAAVAVPFSPNNSVEFDQSEYTTSGHIMGTVVKDELDWGIVFLRADNSVLQTLVLGNKSAE